MKFMQKSAALGLAFVVTQQVMAQPASVQLTGVVRDFRASAEPGGHLDFETLQQFQEGAGPKIYCINLVAPQLGPMGFPQLNGRWHSQDSAVTERLLDVDFVYPNIGYAVGGSGRLLKTINGGGTWTPIATPGAVFLTGVDFLTEQRGFITRSDGRVLETSNGGATWLTPMVAPAAALWDIQFPVDDQVGYAFATGGAIFRRSMAGWAARAVIAGREVRSMHFPVNNNEGCAVGLNGAIVRTTDGFNPASNTIIIGAANPANGLFDLHDVHFVNATRGFTVGENGWIMRTNNGGASWARVGIGATTETLCGVHMVDPTTIFVVGVGGTALVSRDIGITWTDAVSDATVSLNSVCFPVGTVGFAVGDNGAIERFGAGQLITAPWTDSAGRPISPTLFNPALGDSMGTYGNPYFERIHTEAGFAQWWTDVPGVNLSKALTITLERQVDGTYLFDSATQEPYASRGGFFPIDGELFGNYPAMPSHNFHFTFHVQGTFTYSAAAGQMLDFEGDDDVWVYFDGKQVVDVGGRHPARRQYVDLARLNLTDGQEYTMDFFSAERQTAGSNIRIRTNIQFKPSGPITISGGWD